MTASHVGFSMILILKRPPISTVFFVSLLILTCGPCCIVEVCHLFQCQGAVMDGVLEYRLWLPTAFLC